MCALHRVSLLIFFFVILLVSTHACSARPINGRRKPPDLDWPLARADGPVAETPSKPNIEDENYSSLLLNSLPRGQYIPPSGPSRRSNKKNN
ncbi:hypothetical protein KFK09_016803 [Dendrobium nobile]|uniref:Uncharacterized protein n=1 Tax=Dendrobium nobile TaxID=94219 RepID=A0A8T3B131_DENNO|nr:hypothetical protein KFK09_016803 [Dendrobium nobile]